ncbi:MAG: ATP-dependent DNA ligase [Actinobacteria bacterium]|nr:ATP-dependent DNA ligase [Actinomycetota bacterium]
MTLPVQPPFRPMLSKAAPALPAGDDHDFTFEPKWDGFRCTIVRDGDRIGLGSRNEKPLTRYFPELMEPIRDMLPERIVLDGEVVVATERGLDFDALGQRIHPAESRITRLSLETPASFVAFDLIALGDVDHQQTPFGERRQLLETIMDGTAPPLHLTPATTDRAVAADWFTRFEGAGFDGVMAKPNGDPYLQNKRSIFKIKHQRTADVVVAGYRVHKDGNGVGSLLLGLFDDTDTLHSIGVASSFTAERRVELLDELAPFVDGGIDGHPWAAWGDAEAHATAGRMPGAPSRWSGQRDQSWVPLRCELVAEMSYQGLTAGRLRHPAKFLRWRPDKTPDQCRYDQLDAPVPIELARLFSTGEFDR